jgi:hypothetical protein
MYEAVIRGNIGYLLKRHVPAILKSYPCKERSDGLSRGDTVKEINGCHHDY